MELNQSLLLLIQSLYMGVLHTILCSALLFLLLNEWFWIIILQCTKEGGYIHFPSWNLKLSNLDLNIYLPALNLLNAFLSTKDESLKAQGPLYNTSVPFLNDSLKTCTTIPKHFSKFWVWFPSWSPHDVLACLLSWRCSCIILLVLKIFMGSCPWAPA